MTDKILQELRSQLGKDEKLIFTLRPKLAPWMVNTVVVAVILGMVFIAAGIMIIILAESIFGGVCIIFSMLFMGGLILFGYLSWSYTRYAATNHRVVMQQGILNRTFKEAKFEKVTDTIVLRPFIARIFKAGTIGFNTAGGGAGAGAAGQLGYEVLWANIANPTKVKARVSELISQAQKDAKTEEYRLMAEQMGRQAVPAVGATDPSDSDPAAPPAGDGAFCGDCGAQGAPGQKFCKKCGTRL